MIERTWYAVLVLLVLASCTNTGSTLAPNTCVYDDTTLTCGSSVIVVSRGVEHNLTANEPYEIANLESTLVAVYDPSRPEGNRTFLLFLKHGVNEFGEEESKEAVADTVAESI